MVCNAMPAHLFQSLMAIRKNSLTSIRVIQTVQCLHIKFLSEKKHDICIFYTIISNEEFGFFDIESV